MTANNAFETACEDAVVYQRLEQLLSMPDQKRQGLVHAWVTDLLMQGHFQVQAPGASIVPSNPASTPTLTCDTW
jgi:hypothetical protein